MEESRPIVLWHAGCVDGFTALWAVYRALGEVEAVRGYYSPNDEEIARLTELITGRDVYIVDLSYPLDVLQRWCGHANTIVLWDHHKTAFEVLASLWGYEGEDAKRWAAEEQEASIAVGNLFVWLDKSRSGAGITWDRLFGRNPEECKGSGVDHESRPWLVDYVEDRDLWNWRLPDSREVSAFVMHQEQTFERWDCMADAMTVEDARMAGTAAKTVVDHYVADTVSKARICELGGHLVPVVNATYWHTSEVCEKLSVTPMCLHRGISVEDAKAAFEAFLSSSFAYEDGVHTTRNGALVPIRSMVKRPPFAASYYVRPDGQVSYSLRSNGDEPFDVSALAKMFGGGGHHQAAGFVVAAPVHEMEKTT